MGELVVHVGPIGHGHWSAVLDNTLAAVNAAALAEAIVVAEAAGLDQEALVRVIAASSGASTMLDLKPAPMGDRDFDPLFRLGHMLKDVRLALDAAAGLGVEARVAQVAERLYAEAEAGARGEDDFAAVIESVGRPRAWDRGSAA